MSNTLTCHETARHLSALFTPPQALSLLRGVTARLAKCGTVTVVASNKPGWRVHIGSLRDVAFAARTDGYLLSSDGAARRASAASTAPPPVRLLPKLHRMVSLGAPFDAQPLACPWGASPSDRTILSTFHDSSSFSAPALCGCLVDSFCQ